MSLRMFLLDQRYNGALAGIDTHVIQRFIQAYNHARHEPQVSITNHKIYVFMNSKLLE